MLLVYASRTSNIERIVDSLNLDKSSLLDISEGYDGFLEKEFILLTYTDLLGSIPTVVDQFLSRNSRFLRGVAGSGNRNFGNNFCGAAKQISQKYGVPILAQFELSGTQKEIDDFKKFFMDISCRN